MSPDDALRLAAWVDGLFAETTPQQIEYLADQFAPFDAKVTEAEINRYRRHFETLNIANLLRRINDQQQKQAPRPVSGKARREIDAQWQRDDAALAKLSDADLEQHKQAVLQKQPQLRRFLADKDPRSNVWLRSLILDQRLKSTTPRSGSRSQPI